MDLYDYLLNLFPFKNITEESLNKIIESLNCEIQIFSKGDVVFSDSSYEKKIGFIMDGECKVYKSRAEKDSVFLNNLKKYSSFGILSVLNPEDEYPTQVIATKSTKVLFIPAEEFISIIKRFPTVAMNVICFLSKRISFLNKKLGTFSAKSVEDKLALYIIEKSNECNSLPYSATKLSTLLNTGRASIYRAVESLCDQGAIKIENKKIIILNKSKLKGDN